MNAALVPRPAWSVRSCLLTLNPAALAMFRFNSAEVIGQPMSEMIIPPDLREAHKHGFARHLATGTTVILGKLIEIPAVRKDGTQFMAEPTVTRIATDGQPMFTAHIRDITERKQTEQKIHNQLEELQRWHAAVLGREDRVAELKREVNALLRQLGEPDRYAGPESAPPDTDPSP